MTTNTELADFQNLMLKGIELRQVVDSEIRKCVIYTDDKFKVLFCGKKKNSSTAEYYMFNNFTNIETINDDTIVISFRENTLVLVILNVRVRNYMARLFTDMFKASLSQ